VNREWSLFTIYAVQQPDRVFLLGVLELPPQPEETGLLGLHGVLELPPQPEETLGPFTGKPA